MPIIRNVHLDDARLACFRALPSKAVQARSDPDDPWFVAEGRFCVEQLAACDLATKAVVVQEGREDEIASWFPASTDVFVLTREQIRGLVGFDFHRGVMACGQRPAFGQIEDLEFPSGRLPLAVAALGITDRDNLGSIIRTATALGIRQMICDSRTNDPYSRRTIRVSMATVFSQSIYWAGHAEASLSRLASENRVRLVATTLRSHATPLDAFEIDDRPVLLMLGSESDGLPDALLSIATDRVTIAMQPGTDSLNVSVAAAIFMYQLSLQMRQRQ